MIKVLGICGSPVKDGNTMAFIQEVINSIQSNDVEAKIISAADLTISDCKHCNFCILKQTRENICGVKDDMEAVYPQILAADIIIMASPVYLHRLSGYLACFMDRLRALLHGKVYSHALRDKIGVALAVSWFRNAGLETALLSITAGMITMGLITIGGFPGYGGGALSSKNGTGIFDAKKRLGVLEDEYGLETGKKTAAHALELARIIKAGKEVIAQNQTGKKSCEPSVY